MDKSRVCINQATKLAKKKCVKKTNLLVYEKKKDCSDESTGSGYVIPPIASIPAKRIRVCTGAELKKMCPPKMCSCPPMGTRSLGIFGFITGLLWFGIKAAVAGGLVYWTYSAGLWGDSEQTEEIYVSFCETFCPEAAKRRKKKISEVCEAEIDLMCEEPEIPTVGGDPCARSPSTEQTVYKFKEKWNSAVVRAFDVLVHFPSYVGALFQKTTSDRADRIEACKDKQKK